MDRMVVNALTIDLEDWYQASEVQAAIGRENWTRCEERLEGSTYRLLALLDEAGVKATFFVLGWNAERYPHLVWEIWRRGHEVAIHGFMHSPIYDQTPVQFRWEIEECLRLVEDITGERPVGHRGECFSIVPRSLWALEALADLGLRYDSTVFPVNHSRYGLPQSPRQPYRIQRRGAHLLTEFPISTVCAWGRNLGFSGGAHLRLLPMWLVTRGIEWLNRRHLPAVVYLRPWELDTGQPRVRLDRLASLRHYGNLAQGEERLRHLLGTYEFGTMREVLGGIEHTLPCHSLEAAHEWALGRGAVPSHSPQVT